MVVRPTIRIGVTFAALLALAACSDRAPPPVVAAPAPPTAAEAPSPLAPVSGDQQFIDQAASAGAAEVDLGKLAHDKAKAKSVRAFAARMVSDHTKANNRLVAVTKKLNMTPNVAPADTSQLASLSGADFDKAYIANQVQAHQDAVAAFEAEAKDGQVPQLKKFAHDFLPMLQSHLKQAQTISAKIGG